MAEENPSVNRNGSRLIESFKEEIKHEKPEEFPKSIDNVLEIIKEEKNDSYTQNIAVSEEIIIKDEVFYESEDEITKNEGNVQLMYRHDVIVKEHHNNKYIENMNIEEVTSNLIKHEYDTIANNLEEEFEYNSDVTPNVKVENNKNYRKSEYTKNINTDFQRVNSNTINEQTKLVINDDHNIINCNYITTEQLNKEVLNPEISNVENKTDFLITIPQIANVLTSPQDKIIHDDTLNKEANGTHKYELRVRSVSKTKIISQTTDNEMKKYNRKQHACRVCGKTFNVASKLKTHTRIHTGEKLYPCNICGKAFNVSSNLKIHKRIHTGHKPYSCQVCAKCFSDPNHLRTHKRLHTGERPYSCKICGKAFNRSNDLTKHIRIHTGETPYSCSVCGKAFKNASHLKAHSLIHTGERPYSCDICPQKFKRKSNLVNHSAKHIFLVV